MSKLTLDSMNHTQRAQFAKRLYGIRVRRNIAWIEFLKRLSKTETK